MLESSKENTSNYTINSVWIKAVSVCAWLFLCVRCSSQQCPHHIPTTRSVNPLRVSCHFWVCASGCFHSVLAQCSPEEIPNREACHLFQCLHRGTPMNVTGTPVGTALLCCWVPDRAVVLLNYLRVQGTFNWPKPAKLLVPLEMLQSAEAPGNRKPFSPNVKNGSWEKGGVLWPFIFARSGSY